MSHIRESYFRVLQIFLLTANNSQYRQPYQPIGYSNRIKNDIFLESAHRGNALHYDIPNRYVSRNNSVPNTYPSPYMPRPSTPTRNFPSQISPTPNRTANMGRGLLATAALIVTVGQVEIDLAGEITVADTVVPVRIVV